ncbi:MAG: hypothetical protein ACOYJJ_05620 [Anaerovoracaceae bacterium]
MAKKKRVMILAVAALAVFLAVFLAGCGEKYAGSKYVGTWAANKAVVSGVEVDVSDVIGDVQFALKADGTVELKMDGETSTGNWEETKKGIKMTDSSDSSLNFTYKEGKYLAMKADDGGTIYFKKKK